MTDRERASTPDPELGRASRWFLRVITALMVAGLAFFLVDAIIG